MNPNEPEIPEVAPTADTEDGAAPAAAKPRRRRAPKPAAEADDTSGALARQFAPQLDEAGAPAPSEAAAPAVSEAAASPGVASGSGPASGPEGRAGEAGVQGDSSDAAVENGDSDPAEADGRRRRSRNRRRGRRGADRTAHPSGGAERDGEQPEAADALPAPPALPPADVGELFAEVVSGAYDAVAEVAGSEIDAPTEPGRRVLAPEPDAPKLHKVLAQSGVGSRRDLEQMIVDGRVTVNGQPAHVGQRISFGDRIAIDEKPVRVRINPPLPRVLAYHKPAGEVVSHDDPQQRPTVFRRLPRLQHGKWQSVGRLDINTEGLLLFTNSGDLANRLMHPRFGVEREYAVRVLGLLSDDERAKLLAGVEIDGQPAAFRSIEDGGGEGVNHWYRVVITEGRNREVRKLLDAVGHAVSRLIRIRYGSVVLPRGLKRGVWVDLGGDDVKALRQCTGMQRHAGPSAAPEEARGRRSGRRGRGGRREDGERLPPGVERAPQGPHDDHFDDEHRGPIPNPLQQTFDKRAIQQARRQREFPEDGPIPNPLQQTYDKRALQGERTPAPDIDDDGPIPNPLQQTYDKRFAQGPKRGAGANGAGGGGRGRKKGRAQRGPGGGERQPDPLRTATGYIGANAFHQKSRRGGRGGGGGGSGAPGGSRGGRGR
jgi:23S rRNA pseudouridine2605 synthase